MPKNNTNLSTTQVNFLKFIKENEASRGRWVPEFVTPHTHFAIGAFATDDIMITVQEKKQIEHLFTVSGSSKEPRMFLLTAEGEKALSVEVGI